MPLPIRKLQRTYPKTKVSTKSLLTHQIQEKPRTKQLHVHKQPCHVDRTNDEASDKLNADRTVTSPSGVVWQRRRQQQTHGNRRAKLVCVRKVRMHGNGAAERRERDDRTVYNMGRGRVRVRPLGTFGPIEFWRSTTNFWRTNWVKLLLWTFVFVYCVIYWSGKARACCRTLFTFVLLLSLRLKSLFHNGCLRVEADTL